MLDWVYQSSVKVAFTGRRHGCFGIMTTPLVFRFAAKILKKRRKSFFCYTVCVISVVLLFLTVTNQKQEKSKKQGEKSAVFKTYSLFHQDLHNLNKVNRGISNPLHIKRLTSRNNTNNPNVQACQYPRLNPFDADIVKRFKPFPPIICSKEPNWFEKVSGGKIKLNIPKSIKDQNGKITCRIVYILRLDDFNVKYTDSIQISENVDFKLENDFFRLICENSKKEQLHQSSHAGIAYREHSRLVKENTTRGLGFDIFMLGLDSVSHMHFLRKLPKTYKYFTETMRGEVLNGYNIVGDGTPQALIPILTGKTETELPPTLRRSANRQHVNVYPFIWKDFHNHGYMTAFAEDQPQFGCFTYRMIGFNEQPTDHYMRTFHLSIMKNEIQKNPEFCLGPYTRSKIFFEWSKDFHSMYEKKRKFFFGFLNEFSHNLPDVVAAIDDDLLALLAGLFEGRKLSNTIFILFSDHGTRYGDIRRTVQGKQEERLPFFGFVFPESFRNLHRKAFENFKTNTERLTTPFDIHPTLMDMIAFGGDGKGKIQDRGISLFKEIPSSRSCKDAHVASHWCACQRWENINSSNVIIQQAARKIVEHINSITFPFRALCSLLELENITKVLYSVPDKDMLRFKGSKDADGLIPDMSDDLKVDRELYQLWVVTQPGGGFFESTIGYIKKDKSFVIQTTDISRLNEYGKAPACIEKTHEELRKYCVCK